MTYWRPSDAPRPAPAPVPSPVVERDPLTVHELIRLFVDRRCRYGSAREVCTQRELHRLELLRWMVRRGDINDAG